jgi:hypothetical protein
MKQTKTTLQQETEAYWLISSQWNGRVDKGVKTQDGLRRVAVSLSRIGPKRLLHKHLDALQADIINPQKSKKPKHVAPPLPLKKAEAQ